MMGQVVTEPGTRVREVWNGSRLQWEENLIPDGVPYTTAFFCQKHSRLFTFNVYAMFRQVSFKLTSSNIYTQSKMRTECVSPNLCVDQFHQLVQRLFSSNPGIEHAGNVFNIRFKGPWWGAQVAKEVRDHVSQGWFTIIVFAVMIKSVVLYRNQNKNIKNKSRTLCRAHVK